jgi:integrase
MQLDTVAAQDAADILAPVKRLALDAVSSPHTKAIYKVALDGFLRWWERSERRPFNRATVQAYRSHLEASWLAGGIGTPVEPRNIDRDYARILKLAGLHHVRIHDLRHGCATLLLTQGVHPRPQPDCDDDEVLADGSGASQRGSRSNGRYIEDSGPRCYHHSFGDPKIST